MAGNWIIIVAFVGVSKAGIGPVAAAVPAGSGYRHGPGSVYGRHVAAAASHQAGQSAHSRPTQHADHWWTNDSRFQRQTAASWLLRLSRNATRHKVQASQQRDIGSCLSISPQCPYFHKISDKGYKFRVTKFATRDNLEVELSRKTAAKEFCG